jgi:signal transduction histidine kinase
VLKRTWQRNLKSFPAISLRTQAWLISTALLVLTAILGAKAYSVAHTHYQEMSELVNYDLSIQSLMKEDRLRQPLEVFREEKLTQAHETALGLFRLILWAMLISGAVTAWLFYLFFRGLVRPLHTLKAATQRVGSGELSCRISTGSGLQELRDLSSSFNSMAEKLQKLDQAKTEFLATISHEIKNPLAALKEGLNLLSTRNEDLSPAARAKGFAACLIASKRLESMINNLLQNSRMEAGFFRQDMRFKDLHLPLQTAMDEVRPMAEKRQIRFDFAPESESLMATFSSDGMIQVFENLFLNAIKYGSENSTIEVRACRARRPAQNKGDPIPQVLIEISNTGPTIDDSEIKRIFERFYRGSNLGITSASSMTPSGMGLGLHVVKTIIEAHHGEITVHSLKGRTTFKIYLPIGVEPEIERHSRPSSYVEAYHSTL